MSSPHRDDAFEAALRDPATKLFNKRYFLERLDSELKFSRRHETALSLLMIDIDHFKKVNDTHGHLAGDKVLANLATVVTRAVRPACFTTPWCRSTSSTKFGIRSWSSRR